MLKYFLIRRNNHIMVDCIPEACYRIAECWPEFERWLTEDDIKGADFIIAEEMQRLLDE